MCKLLVLVLSMSALTLTLRADILFDTMGSSKSFGDGGYGFGTDPVNGVHGDKGLAAAFSVNGPFLIRDVALPVGWLAGRDVIEIGLYNDSGPEVPPLFNPTGQLILPYPIGRPGQLLTGGFGLMKYWYPEPNHNIVTIDVPDNFVLSAGNYWLAVSVLDRRVDFASWNISLERSFLEPVVGMDDSGQSTGFVGASEPLAFRVDGVTVPEPETWILLATVVLTLFAVRGHRARKRSARSS
jgi:hypothetical protein